jgi:FkbM family methyltransferase
MDLELQLWRQLSLRLPRIRGAGALSNLMLKAWRRKPREEAVEVDVLGSRMRLLPSEFVDVQLLFHPHLYDHRELAYLAAHLPKGGVFLDAGAHVGFYSLAAARQVGPQGRVISVEADPETHARLQAHATRNGMDQITAVHVGLSDETTTLSLGRDRTGNGGRSSFLFARDEAVQVACRPLLDVLTDLGIDHIDGAKFDIEGMESRVLRRFLAEAPRSLWPKFLVCEYYPEWSEIAGGDTIALLREHGYREAPMPARSANRILTL